MNMDFLVHPDSYPDEKYNELLHQAAREGFKSFLYDGFVIDASKMPTVMLAYEILLVSGKEMETLYYPRIYFNTETREASVIQHTDILELFPDGFAQFPYIINKTSKFWAEQWDGHTCEEDWAYFTVGFSFPNILIPEKEGERHE